MYCWKIVLYSLYILHLPWVLPTLLLSVFIFTSFYSFIYVYIASLNISVWLHQFISLVSTSLVLLHLWFCVGTISPAHCSYFVGIIWSFLILYISSYLCPVFILVQFIDNWKICAYLILIVIWFDSVFFVFDIIFIIIINSKIMVTHPVIYLSIFFATLMSLLLT